MNNSNQGPNQIKEIVEGWTDNKLAAVHTALPGKIVSYSPATNRAQVQPFGKYKLDDGRSFDYPVIHNVPVQFPMGCGGSSGVTFPLRAGDGCLLIFAESQLDDYLSGGDSDDTRKHDMNDAMCIPGLYSGAAPSNVSHASDVCLFNGGSLVLLGSGGRLAGAAGKRRIFRHVGRRNELLVFRRRFSREWNFIDEASARRRHVWRKQDRAAGIKGGGPSWPMILQ